LAPTPMPAGRLASAPFRRRAVQAGVVGNIEARARRWTACLASQSPPARSRRPGAPLRALQSLQLADLTAPLRTVGRHSARKPPAGRPRGSRRPRAYSAASWASEASHVATAKSRGAGCRPMMTGRRCRRPPTACPPRRALPEEAGTGCARVGPLPTPPAHSGARRPGRDPAASSPEIPRPIRAGGMPRCRDAGHERTGVIDNFLGASPLQRQRFACAAVRSSRPLSSPSTGPGGLFWPRCRQDVFTHHQKTTITHLRLHHRNFRSSPQRLESFGRSRPQRAAP
jgi:hypothetical protein